MAEEVRQLFQEYHDQRKCMDRHFRARGAQMRMKAATAAGAKAWQKTARRKLVELLGLKSMVKVPPLARMTGSVDCGDYVRERWLMNTERDIVMPFFLLKPKGVSVPLPAVLCPHGHCAGGKIAVAGIDDDPEMAVKIKEFNYNYGVQFARAGLLAFCPDARGFGERQEIEMRKAPLMSSCHQLQIMGTPLGIPVAGTWVFDLLCLMDYVQQRKDVLPGRIGCAGLSGGGLQTLYYSAVDTRVVCSVVSGYFYGARESLLHLPDNCPCNMIPHMWENFDMGDIGSMIAPRPLLIETGDKDDLNGKPGVANVLPQVRIAGRAFKALVAKDRLKHDVFPGPHRWNGVEAIPWMVKWLSASKASR